VQVSKQVNRNVVRRILVAGGPWVGLLGWFIVVSAPIAYMMAGHTVSLPSARSAIVLGDASNASTESWSLVHVLSDQCQCSQDVLEYLTSRGSLKDVEELVVLIDSAGNSAEKLSRLGYRVWETGAEEFCVTYGSEGVPYFQIKDSNSSLKYSGGYSSPAMPRKYFDLHFLKRARLGFEIPPEPVIGCATSDRLKSILDPFSLKYSFRPQT
jgi:hypothetical protein